jgi:A/G-specific adenine glycosylase
MDKRYFSVKVAKWYHENKRQLPWRLTKDPYAIWLSEIILQQTRVNQGLPYFIRFVEQYPTVIALANAREQDVLRLWQGLGYYTRARNLHKCAKVVAENHLGKFPVTHTDLLKLPGIGEYTAAAIASIAFNEPVAVVDGNVFRVLSRVFGIDCAINSPEGKKKFTTLANELIPDQQPDVHNQAVMEFGALFCTPKNPQCEICVFQTTCFAYKNSLQHALPVKIKSKASRKRYFHYIVIEQGKSLYMKRRDQKDVWFGLYDFPLLEESRPVKIEKLLAKTEPLLPLLKKNGQIKVSGSYKHVLSHQTIFCKFIIVKTAKPVKWKDEVLKSYSFSKILTLPKPVLISRFLADEYLL